MESTLATGLLMGLSATVMMDVWALVLSRFANQPLPNWAAVGRWVGHHTQGRVFN